MKVRTFLMGLILVCSTLSYAANLPVVKLTPVVANAYVQQLHGAGLIKDGAVDSYYVAEIVYAELQRTKTLPQGSPKDPSDSFVADLKKRHELGDTVTMERLSTLFMRDGVSFDPKAMTAGATPAVEKAQVVAQAPVATPAPAATAPVPAPAQAVAPAVPVVTSAQVDDLRVKAEANDSKFNLLNGKVDRLGAQLDQLGRETKLSATTATAVKALQADLSALKQGESKFATKAEWQEAMATFETNALRSFRELLQKETEISLAARTELQNRLAAVEKSQADTANFGSYIPRVLKAEQKVEGLESAVAGFKSTTWLAVGALAFAFLGVVGWYFNRSHITQVKNAQENVTKVAEEASKKASEETLKGYKEVQEEWRKSTQKKIVAAAEKAVTTRVQGLLDQHAEGVRGLIAQGVAPVADRVTAVEKDVAELKGWRQVELDVDLRARLTLLTEEGQKCLVKVDIPADGEVYRVIIRRETNGPESTYEVVGVCGDARLLGNDKKMMYSVKGVKASKVVSTIYRAATIDPKVGKCRLTIPVVEKEWLKVVPDSEPVTQPAELATA
ncbi:MAG: hypothetical protein R3B53_01555 [Candidatus Paceibacterota bacterium]